jgi:hypothetical protein
MKKPTKTHLICHVLATHGPMTRIDIMRRVHTLSGAKGPFKPTSNVAYFNPAVTGHYRMDAKISLLNNGLIHVIGKARNTYIYDLTEAGMAIAKEYTDWLVQ